MKTLLWMLIVTGSINYSPAMTFYYSAEEACIRLYDEIEWRITCPTPDEPFECDFCGAKGTLKDFPYYSEGTSFGTICGYCID